MTTDMTKYLIEANESARDVRTTVRTRQLLAAAAQLMARDGAEAVSMQALADEASVSVGLIYRYFGNKQELLAAVIYQVLDDLAVRVPIAIAGADPDPVRRVAAGFRAYCESIDEHRHAALLTYRESKALGVVVGERLKEQEIATTLPLLEAVTQGIASGLFMPVNAEIATYNLVMLAHAWALKHWYFERAFGFESYVSQQTCFGLSALIKWEYRENYPDLFQTT